MHTLYTHSHTYCTHIHTHTVDTFTHTHAHTHTLYTHSHTHTDGGSAEVFTLLILFTDLTIKCVPYITLLPLKK